MLHVPENLKARRGTSDVCNTVIYHGGSRSHNVLVTNHHNFFLTNSGSPSQLQLCWMRSLDFLDARFVRWGVSARSYFECGGAHLGRLRAVT